MKKRLLKKLTLADKELPARKARNVKGGSDIKLDSGKNLSVGLPTPKPAHVDYYLKVEGIVAE